MRRLASFDDPERAQLLCEALVAEDIASAVRPGPAPGQHTVWIVAEEQLLDAKRLHDAFLANPSAARFQGA
jgi:hypothetical protein